MKNSQIGLARKPLSRVLSPNTEPGDGQSPSPRLRGEGWGGMLITGLNRCIKAAPARAILLRASHRGASESFSPPYEGGARGNTVEIAVNLSGGQAYYPLPPCGG